jgi:zinc transport system ATP-binding protein
VTRPLAIDIRDVTVRLGGRNVLEGASLQLPAGEYLAMIGPNGGGKTTLIRLIVGLLEAECGSVEVLGVPAGTAHARVGYVPQHARFDRDFPIRVLDVTTSARLGGRPLWSRITGRDREIAQACLARLHVDHLAGRPIGALSGGELQRVLIARALAIEPEILILDEPTASLDIESATNFQDLLAELARQYTVVLATHDITALSRHVGSVACVNRTVTLHRAGEINGDVLSRTYGCPVDAIAHGMPHRVLAGHNERGAVE